MNYLKLNSSEVVVSPLIAYEDYQRFYEVMREITGIYLFPLIGLFGIVGNIFVIIVYAKSKIYSTSVYLIALSISDIIKLLNDLAYFLVSFITKFDVKLGERIFFLVYSYTHYIFVFTALNTSWLTCAIAIDRYLTVVRSVSVNQKRALLSIAAIFMISFVLAIPSPLFNEIIDVWDARTNTTVSQINETELGRSDFKKVYHFCNGMIRTVIPIVLLIYLNYKILHVVYENSKRIRNKSKSKNNTKSNSGSRITLMLVTIVLTFIICVFPDSIMTMMQMGYANEGYFIRGIREITDALIAMNSASTFPICLYFSTEFRMKFKELFFTNAPSITKSKTFSNRQLSRVKEEQVDNLLLSQVDGETTN